VEAAPPGPWGGSTAQGGRRTDGGGRRGDAWAPPVRCFLLRERDYQAVLLLLKAPVRCFLRRERVSGGVSFLERESV